MSNPNANVRKFDGAVNAAAYWIYDHLLRAGDIVNDSTVTGTTVKAALNTLSASSSAVFPFVGAGLAEQDLVSYDASAATWRNRTVAAALKGTGADSVKIGTTANAIGLNDISIGNAGSSVNTGIGDNVAIGNNSLKSVTTSRQNTAVGANSAPAVTTGIRNVALGGTTCFQVQSGQKNTAVGYSALSFTEEAVSFCVAIGNDALSVLFAAAGPTVAVGNAALFALTSGTQNTAVGERAGRYTTTGSACTLIGFQSTSKDTESNNTLVGAAVGNVNIGSRNSILGSQAFNSASAAVSDVAVLGYNALTGALTTGANGSVAVGSSALAALTSGVNTAVGYQAGLLLTTGTGNCINGYQAGNILTTGSSMTIFGHDADGDAAARSGCVVLGRGATAAADDTLVVRMGNTSTKEIVVTPVVTSTPVSTVSNLPLTVGGTSYTIPLGPASYNYTSVLTSDEVIAVNNTVVDSTMTVSIPAGTYSFSYVGCITHSTATGGSISLRSSTAATMTWTGRADINASSAIAVDNNTAAVTAGNTGGIIATQSSTSKQVVHARGIITCAAASTITVAVYDSANQNITLHTGSSIAVTRT